MLFIYLSKNVGSVLFRNTKESAGLKLLGKDWLQLFCNSYMRNLQMWPPAAQQNLVCYMPFAGRGLETCIVKFFFPRTKSVAEASYAGISFCIFI